MKKSELKQHLKTAYQSWQSFSIGLAIGIFGLAIILILFFSWQKKQLCRWLNCSSATTLIQKSEQVPVDHVPPSPAANEDDIDEISDERNYSEIITITATPEPTPIIIDENLEPINQDDQYLDQENPASDQSVDNCDCELISSEKTYQIQAGDSLWSIAERELGDGYRWVEIYNLNQGVIGGNPNLIYPHVQLQLPSI